MSIPAEVIQLAEALFGLSTSQRSWVRAVIDQFELPFDFWHKPDSNFISEPVLHGLGDAIRIHHAFSRQALSKDRFEHALERTLILNGIPAALADSRTNRGHDITVNGEKISLKTESASNTKVDFLHISKFMELGKGEWELPLLLQLFLDHMNGYDRIFQFRCLPSPAGKYLYELVEIPKDILLKANNSRLEVMNKSRQNPKPGYGYVTNDITGDAMYQLYFDGGTERKLQIKNIDKKYCIKHATWSFGSLQF